MNETNTGSSELGTFQQQTARLVGLLTDPQQRPRPHDEGSRVEWDNIAQLLGLERNDPDIAMGRFGSPGIQMLGLPGSERYGVRVTSTGGGVPDQVTGLVVSIDGSVTVEKRYPSADYRSPSSPLPAEGTIDIVDITGMITRTTPAGSTLIGPEHPDWGDATRGITRTLLGAATCEPNDDGLHGPSETRQVLQDVLTRGGSFLNQSLNAAVGRSPQGGAPPVV